MKTATQKRSTKWVLDSECPSNICNDRSYFISFKEKNGAVHVGNNVFIDSNGSGMIKVELVIKRTRKKLIFKDILYAPGIIMNLISVSTIRKKVFKIAIGEEHKRSEKQII